MRNQVARQRLFGKVFDMTAAGRDTRKGVITTIDTRHPGTEIAADDCLMKPLQARLKDLQLHRAAGEAACAGPLPTKALPEDSAVATDDALLSLSELGRGATRSGDTGKSLDIENLQTLHRDRPTSLQMFTHNRNIFAPDSERKRRHSYAGPAPPPREFFCPLSKCLMTEPVTLLNTGVTLSRTGLQAWLRTGSRQCPVTGKELSGWVAMESNERLRKRIQAWAAEQGLNFELLDTAAALLQKMRSSGAAEDEIVLNL